MRGFLKHLAITLTLLFNGTAAWSQDGEFKEHSNGLIYHDTTMVQLRHIVDSMNLKYRKCDLYKDYYSYRQAVGWYIRLDSSRFIQQAINDMKYGIPIEDFLQRHPRATATKILVLKYMHENHKGERCLYYNGVIPQSWSSPGIRSDDTLQLPKQQKGSWVYEYHKTTEYNTEYLESFYFPDGFVSQKLKDEYARLVQYADCMVDTNASVFFKGASETGGWFNEQDTSVKRPAYDELTAYLHQKTNHPYLKLKTRKAKDKVPWDSLYRWHTRKDAYIKSTLHKDERFRHLLKKAVDEAIEQRKAAEDLEWMALNYYSPAAALALKRCNIVVGSCSQDLRPREHALDIAVLSAQTINWEIFLRAHLDIMNDRFSRITDGSYAYADRNTYIRELEELGIDVASLIFGIALRIENPSGNHYFGNISRLGRALSESADRADIERKMLAMAVNDSLDLNNRLGMYYLFVNYAYSLKNEDEKKGTLAKVRLVAATFPDFLRKEMTKIDMD
jgi:hypothetical protein